MGIMWSKCLFAWLQSVRMFKTIEINVSARCGWTMNTCRKQMDLGFKLHKRPFFPFTEVTELGRNQGGQMWMECYSRCYSLKLCSGTDWIMWPWYVEVRTDSKFHSSLAPPTFIRENLFRFGFRFMSLGDASKSSDM